MKSTSLAALRIYYNKYAPLWHHWLKSRPNNLLEHEIQLVNYLVEIKFQPNDNDPILFSQRHNIKQVTEKLETNFPAFQEWVITEFKLMLIQLAAKESWNSFVCTNIREFPLDIEIKKHLCLFGYPTLLSIVKSLSNGKELSEEIFTLIKNSTALILNKNEVPYLRFN